MLELQNISFGVLESCLDIIFHFILDSGAARELQLLRECCWQWTGEYF